MRLIEGKIVAEMLIFSVHMMHAMIVWRQFRSFSVVIIVEMVIKSREIIICTEEMGISATILPSMSLINFHPLHLTSLRLELAQCW
jgi:hypothetical protein